MACSLLLFGSNHRNSASLVVVSSLRLSSSLTTVARRQRWIPYYCCSSSSSSLSTVTSSSLGSDELSSATATTATTTTTTTTKQDGDIDSRWLQASRLGLNPCTNRYHAPIVYHEHYSFDGWLSTHTYPMDKFVATAQTLLLKQPQQSRPLVRSPSDFFRPIDQHTIPDEWFHNAFVCPSFLQRFRSKQLSTEEQRYIGFREQCQRPELIRRTFLEVAGTVLTCQLACQWGIASHIAGGTHHAHPTGGAGFTILNDLVVATQFLFDNTPQPSPQTTKTIDMSSEDANDDKANNQNKPNHFIPNIERVLVIDCDVHQGDGTAKFNELWNREDSNHTAGKLFTLSLHCGSNYPHPKATSTYDVPIDDKCQDKEYLQILQDSVNRALNEVQPDFVLYDAGVDVYVDDKLGRLSLTMDGIRRRDRWVLERCVELNIPVAAVVGGGYDVDVNKLARRHAIIHEECAYVWRKNQMWKK